MRDNSEITSLIDIDNIPMNIGVCRYIEGIFIIIDVIKVTGSKDSKRCFCHHLSVLFHDHPWFPVFPIHRHRILYVYRADLPRHDTNTL